MDLDALGGSPIGRLIPIGGTYWRTRRRYEYFAYLADPLPDVVSLGGSTRAALSAAGRAIAQLDQVTRERLGSAPCRDPTSLPAAALSNQDAHAVASVPGWTQGEPLTVGLIDALQAALVRGTRGGYGDSGRLRRGDVFLGCRHGAIESSRFVPAPHGWLHAAVEDLVGWLNYTDARLSPVVQAGLAHYQLETLHPYSDGNGRVGRLAIVLQLVRRGALRHPILAISPWVQAHKAAYQEQLLALSRSGDWDQWLSFFAAGIGDAAEATRGRLEALGDTILADRPAPDRAPQPVRPFVDGEQPAGRPSHDGPRRKGVSPRATRARARRRGRDRFTPSLAAATALAALGVAACGSSGSKPVTGAKGSSEVAASPISTPGRNPFTPRVGTDKPGITPPAAAASTTGGPATYVASLPGLYGGTRNYRTCDAQKLIGFLQQNPAKARAWASTLGISTASISGYVSGLTPVLLRTDTRVTNHGYVNGVADPIQSLLEAGTAVFVDDYGRPVVKCYCGNPLTPPVLYSAPVYTGPLWTSFSTTSITIIEQATTIINTFTLYDPNTGTVFKRTAGAQGHDGPYLKAAPAQPTPGVPTTPTGSPPTPPQQPSPPAQNGTHAAENPVVSLSPNPATQADTVTLDASGFAPGASLEITVERPDGGVEHYPLTASSDGSATYRFDNTTGSAPLGTYTVTVTDTATGAAGSASVAVEPVPGGTGTGTSPGTGTGTGTVT